MLHGADRIPRFGHTRHHQHGSRDPLCVDHWHPHSSAREYERGTRGADGLCRRMGSVQSCGTVRPGKPKHNTLPPRPVRLPPLLDTRQQSTLALPTDPTVFILDGGNGISRPPHNYHGSMRVSASHRDLWLAPERASTSRFRCLHTKAPAC